MTSDAQGFVGVVHCVYLLSGEIGRDGDDLVWSGGAFLGASGERQKGGRKQVVEWPVLPYCRWSFAASFAFIIVSTTRTVGALFLHTLGEGFEEYGAFETHFLDAPLESYFA